MSPPPPPPKMPLGDLQNSRPLPARLIGRPPRTSRRAFPMHMSFNLLPPTSGGRGFSRLLCTQVTTMYISPSHYYSDILDQLVVTAETSFGLDLSERSKWRYSLLARCQDFNGCVTAENAEFVVSASSQGGWTWALMLMEVERSRRGVWESVETYSVPRLRKLDAGFFDQKATPGSERDI
ncbi:hypothetical protein LTR36_000201 [Oleoguttula mirabilis]|uniref:Uncharacterized protein n=1 Tax=Oleoguttula mirabilis TaxID=1507867 RepID=A0AAV9JZL8_9PEZI|nr:hypothetical protein LTR36_000201 [Oleoguttula mirabilis]